MRARRLRTLIVYGSAAMLFLWALAPLVWVLISSVQPERNITAQPVHVGFGDMTLDKYRAVFSDASFRSALVNSVVISICTTAVSVVLASLAAYALARLRMRYGGAALVAAIVTRMIPGIIVVIPAFLLMRQLGLIDSIQGLVIVYVAFLVPYAIWMLRIFFEDIPRSVEAAARMDGCTRVGALVRVVAPLAAPGIAATSVFVFVSSWNEFLLPLVLTSESSKPITVRIAELTGSSGGYYDVGILMAAAAVTALPPMVLVLLMSGQIIRGLTDGGVKA